MTSATPVTLSLRTEADALALVATTFGFHPEDSLVLVVLDRGRPFLARADLPDAGDQWAIGELVACFANAAARNPGSAALLLAYTDHLEVAEETISRLAVELTVQSIEVLVSLRVAQGRWSRADQGDARLRWTDPVPYDLRAHPLLAQRVLEGRVVHRDRAELAATLAPGDHQLRAELERLVRAHPRGLGADVSAEAAPDHQWALSYVRAALESSPDHVPAPRRTRELTELARLLCAVTEASTRDALVDQMTVHNARAHQRLWRSAVTLAPESHLSEPAALLAFSCWLAGDGALAWCALDRCESVDPGHRLALLVTRALEAAVPPSSWTPREP